MPLVWTVVCIVTGNHRKEIKLPPCPPSCEVTYVSGGEEALRMQHSQRPQCAAQF